MSLVYQLSHLPEMYSVYILRYALTYFKGLKDKELDYINEYLFQITSVANSIEYMYNACISIKAKDKKK